MPRFLLIGLALSGWLGWLSPVLAVDYFWDEPDGGSFTSALNWDPFDLPPPPVFLGPGTASDNVNFDLGAMPEDRYTVTGVNGDNNRMRIRNDSLRLEINDYQLLAENPDNPSLIVGVTGGDVADVILSGVGNATLRTNDAVIGLGVGSIGDVTVDHLQWDIDGPLNVGGRAPFVGDVGGDGVLTIQNGSLVASDGGGIGRALGSIGEVVVTASSWTVAESVSVGGQGIGTLTIHNGGVLSSGFGSVASNSTATVDGPGAAWTITGALAMFQGTGAALNIQNGGRVSVGLNEFNTMTANSTTEISLDSGGVLDVRTSIVMNNGAFDFLGGTLHVGEFDGNLVNQAGALAPGNPDEPVGSATVTGNYTHQSAATLQIEVGGTLSGAEHDFVNVEGTALLAGELELAFIDDFTPGGDDEFVVFNTDTLLLGSFSNVADGQRLATTDGLGSFLVHYGATSTFNANQVVLTDFLPMFSADFDLDGDVDGDDLTQWEGDFGVNDSSDADNDGDSDGADFLAWQQQLGSVPTVAVVAAVPEPAPAFQLVLGLVVAASFGRRLR